MKTKTGHEILVLQIMMYKVLYLSLMQSPAVPFPQLSHGEFLSVALGG